MLGATTSFAIPQLVQANVAAKNTDPLLTSPLQVAVAANFASALRSIAKDYYEKSGQHITITVSSSGTLFAQLTHGAQFDVFLSADTARPHALIKAGRVKAEDVRVYAQGRLAFLSSDKAVSTPTMMTNNLEGKKLAIANPKLAPYGEAAQQYFVSIDQWNKVARHVVMGKNVLQTYQFFTTGNANYALVAYSLALAPNSKSNTTAMLIPDNLHPPILQSLAITATPERKAAAIGFAEYLLSHEVQSSLIRWGYQPPNIGSIKAQASATERGQ